MTFILKPDNFVFLQGEAHNNYRKQLNPLFTRKALSTYLPHQQQIYKGYILELLKNGETPKDFYTTAR